MLKNSTSAFAEARRRAATVAVLIRQRSVAGTLTPQGRMLDRRIRRWVRPGFYEHFKSSKDRPMFYRVYELLPHVNYELDSHSYHVVYEAQYAPHRGSKALRELLGGDGFLTPVWRDSYIGPRFTYRGKTLAEAQKRSTYQ